MNARLAAFIVLLAAAATGCFPKARSPSFDPARTQKVEVRGRGLQLVRTIEDRAEVDAFVGCLARAERVRSRWKGPATHSLQIHGPRGGPWLLDAATGEFQVLAIKAGAPVYRLREADLETVRKLLAPAEGG